MLFGNRKRVKFLVLIAENVNIDAVLLLYFTIIFYTDRELNTLIIQLLYHSLTPFFYSLWVFFLRIQIADMKPTETLIVFILKGNQSLT